MNATYHIPFGENTLINCQWIAASVVKSFITERKKFEALNILGTVPYDQVHVWLQKKEPNFFFFRPEKGHGNMVIAWESSETVAETLAMLRVVLNCHKCFTLKQREVIS